MIKIGKLRIGWGSEKKAMQLRPGKIISTYGFSIQWLSTDAQTYVKEGYVGNPDIYTVINRIARTASIAPFKVYRVKDKKKHLLYKAYTGINATVESLQKAMYLKELAYEEDSEHELNELLENPNPRQKQREFIENSIGFKLITGERFWHVVKLDAGANEGKPYALFNLPPQFMGVKGDGTILGIKSYELHIDKLVPLTLEEVIFSRYWNPQYDQYGGHLRGLSPLKAGTKLTTLSNSGLTRGVAMVQSAGAAGILYDQPQPGVEEMSEEQAGKLTTKVNREILGVENSNSISVANGNLGYINFGMKGSEMELLDMQKLTRERIAALYNAPPGLFDPEKSGEHNAREFKKEIITSACIPELDSIRDDWNTVAGLYGEEDLYIDYDLSVFPELQEDHQKLAERLANMWYVKPNEKRIMFGMDEDLDTENMNKYVIPSGLMLLDDLGMNDVDDALNEDEP